jgi:hypothetical protein
VSFACDELKEAVVAQQCRVVLVLVAGDERVEALHYQHPQRVDHAQGTAVVLKAGDNAFGEANLVVELAKGDQACVGADRAAVELHLDLFVVAEGESLLDGALCVHGRSLPKRRYGLTTMPFRRSCRFPFYAT